MDSPGVDVAETRDEVSRRAGAGAGAAGSARAMGDLGFEDEALIAVCATSLCDVRTGRLVAS